MRDLSAGRRGHSRGVFPHKADGSLIIRDGKIVGSELLARISQVPNTFTLVPRPQVRRVMTDAVQAGAILGLYPKS